MRFLMVSCCLAGVASAAHVSTCQVTVPNGGGYASVGTGAKIGETETHDFIITAAHVAGELRRKCQIKYAPYDAIDGHVHSINRDIDVAIITTRRTSIEFFPMVDDRGDVYSEGMSTGIRAIRRIGGEYTGASIEGDSGGPVRLSTGEVVGIVHSRSRMQNGEWTTKTTSAQIIYQRMPTPLRNILRVATIHRPISIYQPIVAVRGKQPQIQAVIAPRLRVVGRGPPLVAVAWGNGTCATPSQFATYDPRIPQAAPPYIGGEPFNPTPEPKQEPPFIARTKPGPQGPAGKDGEPGEQGPPGKDAVVDYERIIAAVVAEMPGLDIDKVTDEVVARLPPLNFQMADQDGPYGEKIQKRLGETVTIKHYRVDVDDIAARVAEKLAQ